MYIHTYLSIYVYTSIMWTYTMLCTYQHVYVCTYESMYVCMYVCMYVRIASLVRSCLDRKHSLANGIVQQSYLSVMGIHQFAPKTRERSESPFSWILKTNHHTPYTHPEVDRIWDIWGESYGSSKDHIPSTPGWLRPLE